jgi:hypothetical protein
VRSSNTRHYRILTLDLVITDGKIILINQAVASDEIRAHNTHTEADKTQLLFYFILCLTNLDAKKEQKKTIILIISCCLLSFTVILTFSSLKQFVIKGSLHNNVDAARAILSPVLHRRLLLVFFSPKSISIGFPKEVFRSFLQ